MTYRQFREFGHRSRLSELFCGPSSTQMQAENTQIAASQQQLQLGQEQQQLQSQQYQQYQQDIQPLTAKLTALSAGDRNQALAAAMPVISQVSGGYDAAKQSILNTVPPGAARDAALANLEVQKGTATGGALATQVQSAPEELANLGAGVGAFSLQQLGAALSGYGGANQAASGVAQEESAAQANKLGLISGLAGAAGTAAGGIFKGSDLRLKSNIRPIYPILDKILRTRVVLFDYRTGSKNQIGVVAQELQRLVPECVESMGDPMKTLMVNYGMLAAVALAGIQELSQRVRSLEEKLEDARHGIAAE